MPYAPDPFAALRQASKHLRRFRARVFVVKVGGELLEVPAQRKALAEQLALLWSFSIPLVLIHGGGTGLDKLCRSLGLPTEKVAGRRVTPPEVLEAAKMAFKGTLQMDLLSDLQAAKLPAVGISGQDAGGLKAKRRAPVQVDGQLVDFGCVGDPEAVDPALLNHLLAGGFVPVVAPFSVGPNGELLNTNADTVAAELAIALGAEKLVFLLDQPGLLRQVGDPRSLVPVADLAELEALRASGAVSGGMRPKLDAARRALEAGVGSVHLVSAIDPDALLREVFTNEGSGTMLLRQRELDGVAP